MHSLRESALPNCEMRTRQFVIVRTFTETGPAMSILRPFQHRPRNLKPAMRLLRAC
jgi:hypothetical protein